MLSNGGSTKHTLDRSRSNGFLLRDGELQPGAVHARIPNQLDGAEHSVCGLKAFLVDEQRTFTADDGSTETINCAKVACLDIDDSPVHVHGETVETYQILSGTGRMLLGDEVIPVGPGSIVVIPPGTRHGLCADADPIRVLMTFAPGLAPVSYEHWRDEQILAEHASAVIRTLTAQA